MSETLSPAEREALQTVITGYGRLNATYLKVKNTMSIGTFRNIIDKGRGDQVNINAIRSILKEEYA